MQGRLEQNGGKIMSKYTALILKVVPIARCAGVPMIRMLALIVLLILISDNVFGKNLESTSGWGIAADRNYIYVIGKENTELVILDKAARRLRTVSYKKFRQLEGILVLASGGIVLGDSKGGSLYLLTPVRESAPKSKTRQPLPRWKEGREGSVTKEKKGMTSSSEASTLPIDYIISELSDPLFGNPRGIAYDFVERPGLVVVDGKKISSYYKLSGGRPVMVGDAITWKGFNNPRDVVVDDKGNAYISTQRIIYKLGAKAKTPQVLLSSPSRDAANYYGITFDRKGSLLITDAKAGIIWAITLKSQSLRAKPQSARKVVVGLRQPTGVTSDPEGRIYIRERGGAIYMIPELGEKEIESSNLTPLDVKLFDENSFNTASTGNFLAEPETLLLARLIFGEARRYKRIYNRTMKQNTMIAIGWSVANRTGENLQWGNTLHGVLLKEKEYPVFSVKSREFREILNPVEFAAGTWKDSLKVATEIRLNETRDLSKGATHYFLRPVPVESSQWAKFVKPVATYDNVRFYHFRSDSFQPIVKASEWHPGREGAVKYR